MKIKARFIVIAVVVVTSLFISAEERYKVAMGDSLSKIGRQFGVPYREIMAVNNMKDTRIFVGQVLAIPTIPTTATKELIAPPESLIAGPASPPVDRYRSPGLSSPSESPVRSNDRISDPRVGIYAGEASIAPLDSEAPSAYAKPVHSYPAPFQDRYAVPAASEIPGYSGVSPYNDGSPVPSSTASRSQASSSTYSNPVGKNSFPRQGARTVPCVSNKGGTYIVQPGDSVHSISKELGVNFWDLRVANNIQFKRIYPGQILKVPDRAF